MKVVKGSRILKMLSDDGWFIVRQRGSHRQYHHPEKKGTVTVNFNPGDDVWGAVLKSVEKQAELIF